MQHVEPEMEPAQKTKSQWGKPTPGPMGETHTENRKLPMGETHTTAQWGNPHYYLYLGEGAVCLLLSPTGQSMGRSALRQRVRVSQRQRNCEMSVQLAFGFVAAIDSCARESAAVDAVAAYARRKPRAELAKKRPIDRVMFNDLRDKRHPLDITSSADLRRLIRERIVQLGITYAVVDQVAGLPARYCSKILSEPPARNITVPVLLTLLGAIGLSFVRDDETIVKLSQRHDWIPRQRNGPQYLPRNI